MKKLPQGITVIIFTIFFNFFFWQEKFGINIVLFTVIFGGLLYFQNPDARNKKQTLISVVGIAISSLGLLYHNSLFSKFMLFSSVFLFVASLMEKQIKTIYYLIPSGFLGIITSPFQKNTFFKTPKKGLSGKTWKWFKLASIPLAITIVFTIIYSLANPIFAKKLNFIVENLGDYLSHIFEHYPFARFIFIAFGLLIGIGIYYYQSLHLFDDNELQHKDDLKRERNKQFPNTTSNVFSMIALKTEFNVALITLISLNALLFFVNMLDINVFFLEDNAINSDYSSMLHKGTWILIFSIILSAGIVLYIFRKNLNFYPKNNLLKITTYLWISQNVILTFSVIARVYHYVAHHGLAYKRIGVVIFVVATIFGLATLVYKVKEKKTNSFLLKTNGIAVFSILLISSLFNWDVIITDHNLAHAKNKQIDYLFELSLSDKTLPILDENRNLLKEKNHQYKNYKLHYKWTRNQSLIERLDYRIERFKNKYEKQSFLSWNLSDQETAKYFGIERK